MKRASALALLSLLAAATLRAGHYEDGIWIPDGVCVSGCGDNGTPERPVRERPERQEPEGPSAADLRKRARDEAAYQKKVQERLALLHEKMARLTSDTVARAGGGARIDLAPRDFYLGAAPSDGEPVAAIAVAAGAYGSATAIPTTALRRAAAILEPVASAGETASTEEAAFLAEQAALMMMGAPVRVTISEKIDTDRRATRQAQALAPVIERMGGAARELARAENDRAQAAREHNQNPSPDQKAAINRAHADAKARAAAAREKIAAASKEVVVIVEPTRRRRP